MRIELPKFHWLLGFHEGRFVTNTFSSSLGTLGNGGCINTRTFNYRVFADISSGNYRDFRLVAESFIIQPYNLGGSKTDMERAEFECSDDGVTQAAKWLSGISTKYGF